MSLENLAQMESSLWEAADQLRANSVLPSSEYCMPVLGVIFLRHATNRYDAARRAIEADQAAGKIPKRALVKADFLKRRALMLPEKARYDSILRLPKGTNLGKTLIDAMDAIEADFEPLKGQLPREYDHFESGLLEDLLRIFDREELRRASGDVFGRIYEYFLMKFAMQGAQDKGEFFTPPSLVNTIVNVIEPEHGLVFDPACGSGGMFVQSSHFIEQLGQDTGHRVTFFGQEKTATTIRLAKMNLAVHGLEGDIREANTFYEDVHNLFGKCDFVMANPPFNVDMVDAEKVKNDRRLPFGLPGVNKEKKVSNGNYLWISYFHSYLGQKGRAGFVMSSQASSAGHTEAEVRRKIVETGDVDVMIAIRSNFFYAHRPLRTLAPRQGQAEGPPRSGAHDRCAPCLPKSHAEDLRLLTGAAREPDGDRLALPWSAGPLPRTRSVVLRSPVWRDRCGAPCRGGSRSRPARTRRTPSAGPCRGPVERPRHGGAQGAAQRRSRAAAVMEPSVFAYAERHDNIEAVYKKLTERRNTADVTELLKELHRIVNEAIRTQAPGDDQSESRLFDLSQIDLEKLRAEFAKKVARKATALQDVRALVEKKLAEMLQRNPLRMDYYRKYSEIIADYNREKDRVTIEETFAKLIELANSLDEEQRRAVEEGLDEEELALFDLLKKDNLTKTDRERLKGAARSLLEELRRLIEPLDKWTQKEQTQAEVEVFILDHVFQELPTPPYSAEEKEAVARRAYRHIWQQSASGLFPSRRAA